MVIHASVPAVMDALKTLLDARPGLDGVRIRTGVTGDKEGKDALEIYGIDEAESTWKDLGNRTIKETYAVVGEIWVHRSGGDSEADMKRARDGAFAVYDELLQTIQTNPNIGGEVTQITEWTYQFVQIFDSEQRIARLAFEIRIMNQLRS